MHLDPDVYRRILQAKLYIDEHYHEGVSLDDLSQRAFFSRFHFHRMFTRVYRRTPHQYLTHTRLQAAKSLLENELATVSNVCYQVGFESAASFSLLFKRACGCTPQSYRNRAIQKKKETQQQPQKFIPHCHIQQFAIGK